MNPFHRKSTIEKAAKAVQKAPTAVKVVRKAPRTGMAVLGGIAGLAAGSAILSSLRRRRESADGDA